MKRTTTQCARAELTEALESIAQCHTIFAWVTLAGALREFRALTTLDDLVLHWVEDRAVVEFATEMAEEYYYATRCSAAVFTGMGFYFVGLDWLRKESKILGPRLLARLGNGREQGAQALCIFEPGEKEGRVSVLW